MFAFAEKITSISDFGKLMEEYLIQSERYRAVIESIEKIAGATDSGEITDEERKLIDSAYKNGMSVRKFSRIIIGHMENQKHMDDGTIPPHIDPRITEILTSKFKVLESREIPYADSVLAKVKCLRKKALYYKHLAVTESTKEALENAISTFKAAQDIANTDLAPTHSLRLELASEFADFYYEIVNSCEGACSIAKQALVEAELASFNEAMGELGAHDEAKHDFDRILYKNKMAAFAIKSLCGCRRTPMEKRKKR